MRADVRQPEAGELRVEVIGRLLKFAGADRTRKLDHPVLHLVVREHQDHQYAGIRQGNEVDMAQGEIALARHGDHASEMGHRRKQVRDVAQEIARGGLVRRQAALQARHLVAWQRLEFEQAVHERRRPRGVGTRPAEVCGDATSPASSRSAMMFRMVAGLTSRPDERASVREPTGSPSERYWEIRVRSSRRARASMS